MRADEGMSWFEKKTKPRQIVRSKYGKIVFKLITRIRVPRHFRDQPAIKIKILTRGRRKHGPTECLSVTPTAGIPPLWLSFIT